MSTGNIFISYRRDDTSGHAGRLYDRLKDRFPGRVIMDVTSIDLGDDFVDEIERQLGACVVFIELIGHEWATITDQSGKRRLDEPRDFVRLEVAIALRRAVTIIPILVEGATMPDASNLPEEIAPLTRHNALTMTESDFDYDVERLIHRLETVFGGPGDFIPQRSPVLPSKPHHPGRVALFIGIGAAALFVVGVIGLIVFLFIYGLNADPNRTANNANSDGSDDSNTSTINRPAKAEVYVANIAMAKDNGGVPGEYTTQFEPTDRTIYCVIELNKGMAGTHVKFVWKLIEVTGSEIIKTADDYTTSSETRWHAPVISPSDWPRGKYRVEIYINDALDKTIDYMIE